MKSLLALALAAGAITSGVTAIASQTLAPAPQITIARQRPPISIGGGFRIVDGRAWLHCDTEAPADGVCHHNPTKGA